MQNIVTPFPIDSHNGLIWLAKNNVQADLIYVDGAHDYEGVARDLRNSIPVLKQGGWILGDDFIHPPVRQAAYDVLGESFVHDKGRKFIWVKE